ncbi:Putative protein of unknown function [Podospora comata]|uniref:Fungal N-terminal domain-containing protein n=1 Tax=Podospora comata TaxID=48703 RepID=A0ABY6SHR6_PODCO|nr:Putative protein of unknown function [Podospora comata]
MDPFSIGIGCITLLEVAQKTIKQLYQLSKRYNDAQSDLFKTITQLQSLANVLELIRYDEGTQHTDSPNRKNDLIMDQVNLCMDIIEELQVVITSINDSRVKWAISGKAAVENIHKKLQTATEQLELTLGVHTLAVAKDIKKDATELLLGQEQIGAQVQRLSEHMGLRDNTGPSHRSSPTTIPSWSRTSQGVCVEASGQCDSSVGAMAGIHESVNDGNYTNDTPSPTNSSQWSGSTAYSPPASISSPISVIDITATLVTPNFNPIYYHTAETGSWSQYQDPATVAPDIPDITFWPSEMQYSPTTMAHKTAKLSKEITVEHVETPTAPSKEEVIRNQFKEAAWSLAPKKKQKSVRETFKEMVRLKAAASVAA